MENECECEEMVAYRIEEESLGEVCPEEQRLFRKVIDKAGGLYEFTHYRCNENDREDVRKCERMLAVWELLQETFHEKTGLEIEIMFYTPAEEDSPSDKMNETFFIVQGIKHPTPAGKALLKKRKIKLFKFRICD